MDNVRFLRDDTLRMAKAKRFKNKPTNIPATLKALRDRAGFSMHDTARELGFKGASSYQRYEDPTLYKKDYLPPALTMRLSELFKGRGDPPITDAEVLSLGPWGGPGAMSIAAPETRFPMPVYGEVQAGVWRETTAPGDEIALTRLPVRPLPSQADEGQYGLIVRGESINRVARDGDFLICVDFQMTSTKPIPGDLVVVERTRDNGAIREWTVKRLTAEFDGRLMLMPESDDARYQEPLPLDGAGSDDATIEIKALVLMVLSITHPSARFEFNPRRSR